MISGYFDGKEYVEGWLASIAICRVRSCLLRAVFVVTVIACTQCARRQRSDRAAV